MGYFQVLSYIEYFQERFNASIKKCDNDFGP